MPDLFKSLLSWIGRVNPWHTVARVPPRSGRRPDLSPSRGGRQPARRHHPGTGRGCEAQYSLNAVTSCGLMSPSGGTPRGEATRRGGPRVTVCQGRHLPHARSVSILVVVDWSRQRLAYGRPGPPPGRAEGPHCPPPGGRQPARRHHPGTGRGCAAQYSLNAVTSCGLMSPSGGGRCVAKPHAGADPA